MTRRARWLYAGLIVAAIQVGGALAAWSDCGVPPIPPVALSIGAGMVYAAGYLFGLGLKASGALP